MTIYRQYVKYIPMALLEFETFYFILVIILASINKFRIPIRQRDD